jgi:hypothetical protein
MTRLHVFSRELTGTQYFERPALLVPIAGFLI